MKSIIYAFLFLTLPISMAGKDSTAIKADSPAATKAAKQEEPKTPPAPSIVKHDTVYVAVKEMPGDISVYVSIAATLLTLFALWFSIRYSKKALEASQKAIDTSQKANDIADATLKEMESQRLAAYRPEFNITSQKIFIEKDNIGLTFGYIEDDDAPELPISSEKIKLKLRNVGMGPAKKIKQIWSFDNHSISNILDRKSEDYVETSNYTGLNINDFLKKCPTVDKFPGFADKMIINNTTSYKNEIRTYSISEFLYKGNKFNLFSVLDFSSEEISLHNYPFKKGIYNHQRTLINYLTKGDSISVELPTYYLPIYQFCIINKKIDEVLDFKYPPLFLELQYLDILNNRYSMKYKLQMRCYNFNTINPIANSDYQSLCFEMDIIEL